MKNSLCLFLFFVAVSVSGYAAEPLKDEFLAALRAKSTDVETIVCNFDQVKHNNLLADDAESHGKFYFKRPSQLTLRYDRPAGDRIVMGNDCFLVVAGGVPNTVKIAQNPFYLQLQQVFTACFSGDIDALSSGGEFRCEKQADHYIVRIVPQSKRARRYVSEVVLVFSQRDMLLDELRMNEPSGNYTRYRFTDRKTNLPVADTLFDCQK